MTDVRNGDHERWQNDAAAYALDALDEAEVRAFEEHLTECARCRAELVAHRQTADALPDAAPELPPPPELRQRLMATVRAEAALRARTGGEAEAPVGAKRPLSANWPGWLRPRAAIAAAAVVVAAVVVAVALSVSGGATQTYAGVVHAPGATASVVRSGQTGRLTYRGMPAPPAGRIYQVWLEHARQPPQPTRTLFSNRSGSVTVGDSLRGVQTVLVTAEPRPDGSLAPTRAPIIVVRLA